MDSEKKMREILNSADEYVGEYQLAEALGITRRSLTEGRSKGRYRLRAYRFGGHVFYRRSEILAELEGDD